MRLFRLRSTLAAAAALFLSGSFVLSAQNEQRIPVGAQPSAIHRVNNELHVFCSGSDANFNGTLDAGEKPASWWVLDATTLAVKSSVVFENSFLDTPPLRPAFTSNSVYLYINGKIQKYSLFTQQIINENVVPVPASAGRVSGLYAGDFAGTEVLYIATRPTFTGPGLLFTYVTSSIDTLQNPETTGINPQQISLNYDLLTQTGFQLLLNEGSGGQSNSTLDVTSFANGVPTKTSVQLGNTGNFFLHQGDTAFVVMTGSHTVQLVDLLKKSVVKTIPTGTTEFNGPRECTINGDTLFVTTYASDIRAFSISTGALLKTLQTSGKVDPIIMTEGKLVAGISLKKDTYTADSALAVFGLAPILSVTSEKMNLIPALVSPNPVENNALLSAEFPENLSSASIEIFTTSGVSVGKFTQEIENGKLQFHINATALKIAQGQYIARISGGNSLSVVPFVVAK